MERAAPKLWNKLSKKEKKEWTSLYKEIYKELEELSEYSNSVKAHNLAFLVIWRKRDEA